MCAFTSATQYKGFRDPFHTEWEGIFLVVLQLEFDHNEPIG